MDRLEEIKRKSRMSPGKPRDIFDLTWTDVEWLISKVETLRGELEGRVKMALDAGRGIGEEAANQKWQFKLDVCEKKLALARESYSQLEECGKAGYWGVCGHDHTPPTRSWDAARLPRPITEEDIIRETNKSYDVGRKHGQEEKVEEIIALKNRIVELEAEKKAERDAKVNPYRERYGKNKNTPC